MANEKISITNNLRLDIIERRKNMGISCYDLSEQVGNGHSKFWLQNIENGKTKKIAKDDLIKIYMILEKTDYPEDVIGTIEQLLKQTIGDTMREWYELIDISDDFSELYTEDDLIDSLDEFLEDQLIPEIRNTIFGMSTNQKQAALTALQHLYYSLYKDPDLAYALLGIPVYGVKELDKSEHITAMNDLLTLYAKFNDLSKKNDSINTIREWQKRDDYYDSLFRDYIHTALDNFKEIISKLYQEIHKENPDITSIRQAFIPDVSFMIEKGQPNVLKHYLKSWQSHTGKDFATHIKECITWFMGFGDEYGLPFIYDVVSQDKLNEIYNYLKNYGKIKLHH